MPTWGGGGGAPDRAPRPAAAGAHGAGPALDGAGQGGGLVLGEDGEQFVGAGVAGADEGLGEVVDGHGPVGVQEGLGGGGHGGAGAAAQPAFVGEPGADQGQDEPGGADEAAGGGLQVVVVGGQQAAQQVEPVGLGQPEPVPEPAAELPGARAGHVLGEGVQDGEVGGGVGGAEQGAAQQPGGPQDALGVDWAVGGRPRCPCFVFWAGS
ncbi:hypothetical protein ACFXC2_36230, partial [Streptomyces lavendulae]